MTPETRAQLRLALKKSPKSIWSYWGFALPFLIVALGILIHAVLIRHLDRTGYEVLIRSEDKTETVWESALVRRLALVTSGCVVSGFALVTLVAIRTVRQCRLLARIEEEMSASDQRR